MADFLLVIAADVFLLASMPACVHVPVGLGCGKRNRKVCVVWGAGGGYYSYLPTYYDMCLYLFGGRRSGV